MNNRIRKKEFKEKIIDVKKATNLIKDGMTIGISGFTPSGYPKAIPLALYNKYKNANKKIKINLLSGASVGDEIDDKLLESNIIKKRFPYQSNNKLRNFINDGIVKYNDIHLSHFPQQVRYGYYGNIDLAIVEAVAITEEGNIIPSTSVGASPTFVEEADKVLVEINLNKPLALEGFHDIYQIQDPPKRKPIEIFNAADRIGLPYIELEDNKLAGIVITDLDDNSALTVLEDKRSKKIANNIIRLLEKEVDKGLIPTNLLPLQSGVGKVADSVLSGLKESSFENIDFYSEVIQDSVFDLIDCGKIRIASGTSITLSKDGYRRFIDNIDQYKNKIILRPQEISNNPEIIRRLGSIAINTAIEVDIYGNINSSHLMGSQIVNGIGGSGDFARNSYLSIFVTTSTAKNDKISSIVPMVPHVDHPEHDVDVIVTEQGLADLRGLSPEEKSNKIIDNCVHPDYKEQLNKYLKKSKKNKGHIPHILDESFSWHNRFSKCNTMKE